MKIGGANIPTPSKLYIVYFAVESKVDRNALGVSVIDRTALKVRLECAWNYLTRGEMSILMTATKPITFLVNYFDPELNDYRDITCIVGERVTGEYQLKDGYPVWISTTMTLTEQ